jgi:hypothetical protein
MIQRNRQQKQWHMIVQRCNPILYIKSPKINRRFPVLPLWGLCGASKRRAIRVILNAGRVPAEKGLTEKGQGVTQKIWEAV